MQNPIGHAWKYTSRKATYHINFCITRIAGEVTLFISDDEIGFDMELKQKLFGAFERLHGSEFDGRGQI